MNGKVENKPHVLIKYLYFTLMESIHTAGAPGLSTNPRSRLPVGEVMFTYVQSLDQALIIQLHVLSSL